MLRSRIAAVSALALATLLCGGMAQAQTKPAAPAANAHGPAPYAKFIEGAKVEPGLLPVIEKDGNVYLEVQTSQLGADFIETAVPYSGLGGFGPAQGEPYVAPARILRFERYGNDVVLRWPNTYASTNPNTPERAGVDRSLPSSVIAVVPIAAQDGTRVVIPAKPFLGDVADLAPALRAAVKAESHAYHLDMSKSFFLATKAFPKNDVLRVDQTWTSAQPDRLDNAPDARNVEVKITYNLIAAPHDGFVPRIADPRVGYFSQPLLDFSNDNGLQRAVHYITRWNFGPRNSAAPAQAANPIVFYLADDIPHQYRATVRAALLTWNDAFAKIGILNAVKVEQQPAGSTWDSDDIRHNMIRWVDTSDPQYGAEALILSDPRTGEELNVGVNFDAIEGIGARLLYKYEVAPARGLPDTPAAEKAFADSFIRSVILHESGHDLGLQHNFIGHEAYTARDLQSKAFTAKYGIASSVMEYAPINLWPRGTPQGDYNQLVLGPYDYYAVNYGYGYIPGAQTPQQEQSTLNRWASRWANPRYRFASDEDADEFASGHSIDPRVVQFNLTDHPIAWCGVQMKMLHGVMNTVNAHFPEPGVPYDEARSAFLTPMRQYVRCATDAAHTIGGEYLSRAQRGDPGAGAPIQPVPLAKERAAWSQMANGLFSEQAWHFNPQVLDTLTYSEYSEFTSAKWAYNPPHRHDVSVAEYASGAQNMVLRELFSPLRLQRIDEFSLRYGRGRTMTMADLFTWAQSSIFGNIANANVVRRNLQTTYAQMLGGMVTAPAPGVPSDAQALARLELQGLRHNVALALQRRNLDTLTRAHLELLGTLAQRALSARIVVPASAKGGM